MPRYVTVFEVMARNGKLLCQLSWHRLLGISVDVLLTKPDNHLALSQGVKNCSFLDKSFNTFTEEDKRERDVEVISFVALW